MENYLAALKFKLFNWLEITLCVSNLFKIIIIIFLNPYSSYECLEKLQKLIKSV